MLKKIGSIDCFLFLVQYILLALCIRERGETWPFDITPEKRKTLCDSSRLHPHSTFSGSHERRIHGSKKRRRIMKVHPCNHFCEFKTQDCKSFWHVSSFMKCCQAQKCHQTCLWGVIINFLQEGLGSGIQVMLLQRFEGQFTKEIKDVLKLIYSNSKYKHHGGFTDLPRYCIWFLPV